MRAKVELVVYICLYVALYVNLTSFPVKPHSREVQGTLVRIS